MKKVSERTIRSILYRRRLLADLALLEFEVLQAVRESERDALIVKQFVLREAPDGLAISERPRTDPTQLHLPLDRA